jgi:hypothetical protein
MTYFTAEGWVALSAIAAVGILAFLHLLARMSATARALTQLKSDATSLRLGYAERLAALRAREAGEVVEVDAAEDQSPVDVEQALRQAA